jgi:hypothetical protein
MGLGAEPGLRQLAADEECRHSSHERRGHEAPINEIMGTRSADQRAPDQSPVLDAIDIG